MSLNREQREKEMEAQEAEQLALENQRRIALGAEPLEELSGTRTDDEEDAETEGNSEKEDEEDVMPAERAQVLEAAEILLDYAQLQASQRMALN